MKYGPISGNNSINALIYSCFNYICGEDERKFVKKFREQPRESDQIMHTLKELILGAYLSSKGFSLRYDYTIDNKTPDWTILDEAIQSIVGIVELTSFHIDKTTENKIKKQINAGCIAVYWRDKNRDNVTRLYQIIEFKAQLYKSLIRKLRVPYVVSVFGEFTVPINFEEVWSCLFNEEIGLFTLYPELSGILYFEENSGRYLFRYASNPNALKIIKLPAGSFPNEAA